MFVRHNLLIISIFSFFLSFSCSDEKVIEVESHSSVEDSSSTENTEDALSSNEEREDLVPVVQPQILRDENENVQLNEELNKSENQEVETSNNQEKTVLEDDNALLENGEELVVQEEPKIEVLEMDGPELLCLPENSLTIYCKMNSDEISGFQWSVIDNNNQTIDANLYDIEFLVDVKWGLKITFATQYTSALIRARKEQVSQIEGQQIFHVSQSFPIDGTTQTIQQTLSLVYASPEWGDLDLSIEPSKLASGNYAYSSIAGVLTGNLSVERMEIVGRYSESSNGVVVEEGDLMFTFSISQSLVVTADGQYREDGTSKWGPWTLSPK